MTFSSAALLIIVTVIAASYGWGMRGAVIGGEKGAMLPGILIGICISLFSGIDALRDNWYVIAAASGLGMGFGGFEPYAQTSDFMLKKDAEYYKPSVAFKGLMIKGANWFGIFGAITGIALSAAAGKYYSPSDIIILLVLQPFIQILGIKIFNKPFDAEKGVFPKAYFSRTSREEWGGNLLFLVSLIIFSAVRGDIYSVGSALTGIVFGSFGWFFSMWLCHIVSHPLKNGKYVYGKLYKLGITDSWKTMEFSYGAIGGLAFSLYFVLTFSHVEELFADGYAPFFGLNMGFELSYFAFALALLSPALWGIGRFAKSKNIKNAKLIERICELTERAIIYSFILCLILLGDKTISRLTVVSLVFWVLIEENVFEQRLKVLKHPKVVYIASFLVFGLTVFAEIFLQDGLPLYMILIIYTVFYIASDMMFWFNIPQLASKRRTASDFKNKITAHGGAVTVHPWFIIQSAALFVIFGLKGFLLI